jgi:hypothetical protein
MRNLGIGEVIVGVARLWDGHAATQSMVEGGEGLSQWDGMGWRKRDEMKGSKGSEGAVEGELGGGSWKGSYRGGQKQREATMPEREGD